MATLVTKRRPLVKHPWVVGGLGYFLRQVRRHQRLKMALVASRAGISVAYLEQLEGGGKRDPSLQVLVALSQALHVAPSLALQAWQEGARDAA